MRHILDFALHRAPALLAFFLFVLPVCVDAAPVPIESFFEHPTFMGATLSPSGHFVAVRVANKNNDGRAALAVLELGIA